MDDSDYNVTDEDGSFDSASEETTASGSGSSSSDSGSSSSSSDDEQSKAPATCMLKRPAGASLIL